MGGNRIMYFFLKYKFYTIIDTLLFNTFETYICQNNSSVFSYECLMKLENT